MTHNIRIYYTHRLVAEALKSMIDQQGKLEVSDLHPFNPTINPTVDHAPVILLLEISFPNAVLVDTVKRLKNAGFKIIIVGLMINNGIMEEIINAKVDAYILKSCSDKNLFTCIDEVINGSKFYCYTITECLQKRLCNKNGKSNNELTDREKDVLKGVVNFQSSKQIAADLNISSATVRTHRKNIMLKMGAKNYIGLLRKACSMGLLADSDDHFCEGCVKLKCHSPHFG